MCGWLPTPPAMCYNLRAVEGPVGNAPEAAPGSEQEKEPVVAAENASLFCPVCSERLTPRKCKLICAACGYYMSCSDYY